MSIIKGKDYKEHQALQTLHRVCGFKLEDWTCSDKPDLQSVDEDYGIEVVQDVYSKEQEMSRFIESVWNRTDSDINPQKTQKFKQMGGSIVFENGCIKSASLGTTSSSPDHLIATVKKKIDLLNERQYRSFNQYGLFVFVETAFIDENFISFVQQVVDEVFEYQQTKSFKFDILYLEQSYVMCVCDLRKKTFQHIQIPEKMRNVMHQETQKIWED